MKIVFSRHAKRRAKLYNIEESTISDILMRKHLSQGEQVIVQDTRGMQYPLKIVVSVENDTATVISSYPLKKGKRK
jgi:hypothetical protein